MYNDPELVIEEHCSVLNSIRFQPSANPLYINEICTNLWPEHTYTCITLKIPALDIYIYLIIINYNLIINDQLYCNPIDDEVA